ncbi:MAG: hypothetical protein V5A45_11020 [Haloarculaceae archaeon]|jgi:predicted transcriptional regulator
MDEANCRVLAAVVDRYDRTGEPVSAAAVADTLGRATTAVSDRLAELESCEFLAPAGDGYRPTVTGREFLELDIECGPVIVDTDDE